MAIKPRYIYKIKLDRFVSRTRGKNGDSIFIHVTQEAHVALILRLTGKNLVGQEVKEISQKKIRS